MSAIEKVNCSGLSVVEKRALKALMGHKPSISDQIVEDSAVDDDLLRAYLLVPGKKLHQFTFIVLHLVCCLYLSIVIFYFYMLLNLCCFLPLISPGATDLVPTQAGNFIHSKH